MQPIQQPAEKVQRPPGPGPLRRRLSRIVDLLAISMLFTTPVVLACLWLGLAGQGRAPNPADYADLPHGPWHGTHALDIALQPLVFAFLLSLVSLALHPNRRPALILVASIVVFFAVLFTHGWLID